MFGLDPTLGKRVPTAYPEKSRGSLALQKELIFHAPKVRVLGGGSIAAFSRPGERPHAAASLVASLQMQLGASASARTACKRKAFCFVVLE